MLSLSLGSTDDLKLVLQGERKDTIGDGKATGGDCRPVSAAVQEALVNRYPDAQIVEGAYFRNREENEGWLHTWVESPSQGLYFDATHDQFGGEPILVGHTSDPFYQEHYEVDEEYKKTGSVVPPLTKEILERVAWEVRDEFAPHGESTGTCQDVSEAIVDKLHALGYSAAHVVFGQFLGHPQHPHTWVSVYDWEVDATQDQFANTNAFEHMETELAENPVYIGPHRKHIGSLQKKALQIEVPKSTRSHFWEEPPVGNLEFWAYRHPVNILPGEKIVFTFDGAPIARAVCHHTEAPGQSKCENTGKYKNHHKVFWLPSSFMRIAGNEIGNQTHARSKSENETQGPGQKS